MIALSQGYVFRIDRLNIWQLWLKIQSVKLTKKPCIRVNTRELDKVPSIKVFILCMLDY